jgi:hypothetical protein
MDHGWVRRPDLAAANGPPKAIGSQDRAVCHDAGTIKAAHEWYAVMLARNY